MAKKNFFLNQPLDNRKNKRRIEKLLNKCQLQFFLNQQRFNHQIIIKIKSIEIITLYFKINQ